MYHNHVYHIQNSGSVYKIYVFTIFDPDSLGRDVCNSDVCNSGTQVANHLHVKIVFHNVYSLLTVKEMAVNSN